MTALEKDGWSLDTTCGAIHTYIKKYETGNRRVQVHFHGKNSGWGPSLVKKMLNEIAWTEEDLRRLKLIK